MIPANFELVMFRKAGGFRNNRPGVLQGFKKCFCRLDASYFDVGRNVAGWSTDH